MHIGARIAARFEVLAEAGRGGMGTVFRARDRKAQCDVALKIIRADGQHGADRFVREAAILSEIEHIGVVRHVTHGVTPDGVHYLVMEWVEGESLAQRLDGVGLDPRETVVLGAQVARALGALHAAGVVHRDVKPSNIMLVERAVDRVKLVDLGVARRRREPLALTRTGAMVGTAGYMSPEQARGVRVELDGRADLFALGCVLHECLTGAAAFPGDNTLATRAKVLLHDPPRVRQLAPAVPAALDELVARLLAKRPGDRPANADEVADALDVIARDPALPAGPDARAPARVPAHRPPSTTITPEPAELVQGAIAIAPADGAGEPDGAAIDPLAARVGAELETLDGVAIVTLFAEAATTRSLAHAISVACPDAAVAVVIGGAVDDAIDRASALLADAQLRGTPGVVGDVR